MSMPTTTCPAPVIPVPSYDGAEQEDEDQAHHGDDRLHDGPGLDRLPDGHPEELFHEPETGVVDVGEEQRPGADRQGHERPVDSGGGDDQRRNDAGGRDGCHGGRAGARAAPASSFTLRVPSPRASPKVHIATITAMRRATTGSPMKSAAVMAVLPLVAVTSTTVR